MQIQEIELKAVNRAEAYRYMGFGNTEPDENIMKIIDEKEKELNDRENQINKMFNEIEGREKCQK